MSFGLSDLIFRGAEWQAFSLGSPNNCDGLGECTFRPGEGAMCRGLGCPPKIIEELSKTLHDGERIGVGGCPCVIVGVGLDGSTEMNACLIESAQASAVDGMLIMDFREVGFQPERLCRRREGVL